MNNYFAKNLRYLREYYGLSKSELASKLKLNQSTISRWENGDMGANVDNAYDVASYFGVSISDLLGKDLNNNNIKPFDELEILFSKNKDILTEDDKEYIRFIVEKRKKEIDKEKGID